MTGRTTVAGAVGPTGDQLLMLGKLSFLAGFCPVHRKLSTEFLGKLFFPAINHDCVRLFENPQNETCAALIWARLSDEVSEAFVRDQRAPTAAEWVSGENLWFLDIIAPFGHGIQVARQIAREPPAEKFRFARINSAGKIHKIVTGNAAAPRYQRLQTQLVAAMGG